MTNPSSWKRASSKKRVWFSLLVMAAMGAVAVLTPWLAPHDPYQWNIPRSNLMPAWVADPDNPGSPDYLLGTDRFGRDILSRLIYGTRTAVLLALAAVSLAAIIGTSLGLVMGYAGGRIDTLGQLLTDIIQSLPGIMFVVLIVLIFRNMLSPSWFHGMITLATGFSLVSWASLARLIRVNVQVLKSQLFVEAAVSLGASSWRLIFYHLLPNVAQVVFVWIINTIPAVILLEAVLGYIGIGVTSAIDGGEFTAVSWGGVFFSGRSAMNRNPLMLVIPTIGILLISMSFILLADHLNESSRKG